MSFQAMVVKESADLLREKRFGAWTLTFLSFWTVFLVFWLQESSAIYRRDNPESVTTLGEVAFFFYGLAFVVLALFLLADGVTKERESGMLPVVGAKPIQRWHVPLAKLVAGLVVYLATFLVTLLPSAVLAWSMGFPVIEMMARLYAGPFLALYVFLLGLGLLLGVVAGSSKVAIGSAAGVLIPAFFMMEDGPMILLYRHYPGLLRLSQYTPFEAAHAATQVVVNGGQMPWGPLAVTVGLGAAFCALAFWIFSRQEAAA